MGGFHCNKGFVKNVVAAMRVKEKSSLYIAFPLQGTFFFVSTVLIAKILELLQEFIELSFSKTK